VILPRAEDAIVEEKKVLEYLLNFGHDDGKDKAAFFARFGFSREAWWELAEALKVHAIKNALVKTVESPFGTRYVVEGPMRTPDGRAPWVRTVWIVEADDVLRESPPRLVTAYPLQERNDDSRA
jgi:hypothetical protein